MIKRLINFFYYTLAGYNQLTEEEENMVDRIYNNHFFEIKNKVQITTQKLMPQISYPNFEASSRRKILNYFGKPLSKFRAHIKNTTISIYTYKKIIHGFRAKVSVHHCKDELFCVSYVYRVLSDNDIDIILQSIKKNNSDLKLLNFENNYINYNKNIIVTFSRDLYFNVNFYNTNSTLYKKLSVPS